MATFVPKSRRPKFLLHLSIIDLNNVPLVSGLSVANWHISSSAAAHHRGRTEKKSIRDHRVEYGYEQELPVRLVVGKDGMLQECPLHIEEYSGGGKGERITLGNVKLNLAEYVETEPQSPGANAPSATEGIVRRYLMQDSKINSTLKIGIYMRQIEGSKDYYAPPLKTAPVFGGIAGIISSSEPTSTHGAAAHPSGEAAQVDGIELPSLSASSREIGEMQDMYRRTLAAYWASQPGELKADEAIEDIFSGGDGWGHNGAPQAIRRTSHLGSTSADHDKKEQHRYTDRHGFGHNRNFSRHSQHKRAPPPKPANELDEFEVRDDLRSWIVSSKAMA